MKIGEKRLVLEIDERLHQSIKIKAIKNKMSVKNWVLVAIANQMQKEEAYVEINESSM